MVLIFTVVLSSFDGDKLTSKESVNLDQLIKKLASLEAKDRKKALKIALELSNKDKALLYDKLVATKDPELILISKKFDGSKYSSLDGLAEGSKEAQLRQRKAVEKGLPLEVKFKKTGIVFRLIPAGKFTLGSDNNEKKRDDEEVAHEVTISKKFYIGKFEITQSQWRKVMGVNPSHFKEAGENAPVENISWEDCRVFIEKLEILEGLKRGSVNLPTEAQWEYTCRAGTKTATYYGDFLSYDQANFYGAKPYESGNKGSFIEEPCAVGSYKPNSWGVYDMHGNVTEWCADWYGDYKDEDIIDPKGPKSGTSRVARGGYFMAYGEDCRSARRSSYNPTSGNASRGLRLIYALGNE